MNDDDYVRRKDLLDWLFSIRRDLMAIDADGSGAKKAALMTINNTIDKVSGLPGKEMRALVPPVESQCRCMAP